MGKKILIVDDEPEIRKALSVRLKGAGYSIDTAQTGKEAVGAFIFALKHNPYDLVVLDIMLPEIDGLEILEIIREQEELRGIRCGDGIPVIMLTAMKESWIESFKKGCDDYIIKPYMPQELLNKIEEKLNLQIGN